MARSWVPLCVGVLVVLIVIVCVVGGCGKTVEGATGDSAAECVSQGIKCNNACGSDDHPCRMCCQQNVLFCPGDTGTPITDAVIERCKKMHSWDV